MFVLFRRKEREKEKNKLMYHDMNKVKKGNCF